MSLEIDEKLTDPQTSIDSGPHYDSINGAFENFQKPFKKGMVFKQRQQSQKKKQLTMFDMFKQLYVQSCLMFCSKRIR